MHLPQASESPAEGCCTRFEDTEPYYIVKAAHRSDLKGLSLGTTYIVRVEMHDASYQHYDRLHRKMEEAGYSRRIQADDGVWYDLPTATYTRLFASSMTASQVADKVAAIANAVRPESWVLAIDYVSCAWRLTKSDNQRFAA